MTASRNECVVVLVYWFDSYYVILGIMSNTNVFDNGKRDLSFSIGNWPLSKAKPGCLKEKNSKYKLEMTISKKMGGRVSMTYFE